MSLVLISNQKFSGIELATGYADYVERVLADGGEISNASETSYAFIFARGNYLNANNVFSATSPYWGIKKVGDTVVKLYNLFSAEGDITVVGGSFKISNINGILGVEHTGSSANKMLTIGTTSAIDVSVISAFRRTASTAMAYVAGLSPPPSATTQNKLVRLLVTPDKQYSYINNVNGEIVSARVDDNKIDVLGTVSHKGKMYQLVNGIYSAPITLPVVPPTNPAHLLLGRESEATTTQIFAGSITESWCTTDATLNQSQAIGTRLAQLYADK